MCDTIGVLRGSYALFGKNSDRSPNEAQVTELYPARIYDGDEVACTYRLIPQAKETLSVLLSRPVWMWGAEIGVNEAGVAIGNEAVFTKGKYGAPSLTGMDLLRLGLERAESAERAVNVIIELLETYGGWASKKVVELYLLYVEKVFERFHQKVTRWFTFNEPIVVQTRVYLDALRWPYEQNTST